MGRDVAIEVKGSPKSPNQQFPGCHIRSAMGGISSTHQDYFGIGRGWTRKPERTHVFDVSELPTLCVWESVTERLSGVDSRRGSGDFSLFQYSKKHFKSSACYFNDWLLDCCVILEATTQINICTAI